MFAKLNFNRFLIVLSLLVIQLFSISEVQAQTKVPGYTTWNDYVKKTISCDTDLNTTCENFAPGKRVYFIIKSVCTWSGNTCVSITNYKYYSNNPYGLLSILTSSLNDFYSRTGSDTVENIPNMEDNYGFLYDIYLNKPSGQEPAGQARIPFVNIPLCSGYLEVAGCPNDKNNEDPLDRKSVV